MKRFSSASFVMSAGCHGRAWVVCALICGLAMLVFAGCTGDGNPQPTITQDNGYVEPAWMAANRQEQEEEAVKLADCMTQSGWKTTVKPDYSFSDPVLTEEQLDAFNEASDACLQQVVGDVTRDAEFWRVKYAHALDTAACLTAAGYSIPAPPSEDVWVDALLNGYSPWTPFQYVIDQGNLDMPTYYALFDQCPQDGPTAGMSRSG